MPTQITMKIVQLAYGTCVTDKETLKNNIPSNDGNLERALLERLFELSDAGESIPKGYEDKTKEPKPRKRASNDVSTTMWLRKNPLNGMMTLSDSNGNVLSRPSEKDDAIRYCKEMGYILWDETETPPKKPTRLAMIQEAAKKHKTRPKSHVGKLEGAFTAPGGSGKIDTRLTPVHRYVLEMDFPILFKQSNGEGL